MYFNDTIIETNNYPIYSIQYIIISGYVIMSWGHYNLVSNLSNNASLCLKERSCTSP